MSLIGDYLAEYDVDDLERIQKIYGRTKGKNRKELLRKMKLIKKNIKKSGRQQKKVDKQLRRVKQHTVTKLKDKAGDKAKKAYDRSQKHLSKAEKMMKKLDKKASKKAPRLSRKLAGRRWTRAGLIAAGAVGLAAAGAAAYKGIKDRRHEGMSITINELRDEILYEIVQDPNLQERSGIIRLVRHVLTKGGQTTVKGTSKGSSGSRIARYGKAMGPLGVAFDIMFIFELGAMAYKRFFAKAAKACKGVPDRSMCIRRYKIGAKGAQTRTLKSKMGLCGKDKNPEKCKAKIRRKIDSLRDDIRMLRKEL